MELHWAFLPELARRKDGRMRPWRENRAVFNGILWILRTGAPWADIDGSFAPAKQGGASIGKTKRGKGSKIMAIVDRQGLPVAVHVESATPHEVRLVHATLAERFVRQLPQRLIGDNAYESDRLDAELARRGVELIAPHRRTRKQRTQEGRPLPLPTDVEERATFCLAPELSANRRALRASRGELSRHATPCLQPH
jgi:transposase